MERHLFHSAAILDAAGVCAAPGALLIEGMKVIAAGSPAEVGHPADATRLLMPGRVLIPALVNAHAHLDLTHIGPRPFHGDFTEWIEMIRRERRTDAAGIIESVAAGASRALAGGTAAVGDIAGTAGRQGDRTPSPSSTSLVPAVAGLCESHLEGVSYLEIFGIGLAEASGLATVAALDDVLPQRCGRIRLGLQPHAPYSCSPAVYAAALASGRPIATHLLETADEIEFLRDGRGRFSRMLRGFGIWNDECTAPGKHPLEALAASLSRGGILAAHLNYATADDIERLARWNVHAVYCPRATAYFGHPQTLDGRHPYREMIDAGVNVSLGTDSIVVLDTPDRISVLDEMRLLHRRDGVDPATLLAMATINGARALGLDESRFTFSRGPVAGVIAVDLAENSAHSPLAAFLQGDGAPAWVVGGGFSPRHCAGG